MFVSGRSGSKVGQEYGLGIPARLRICVFACAVQGDQLRRSGGKVAQDFIRSLIWLSAWPLPFLFIMI